MLNKETAQEISELCVEKIDWTIVGIEGGIVTIFTGRDRYYASYGTEGSDPITETSKSKEPGNASGLNGTEPCPPTIRSSAR